MQVYQAFPKLSRIASSNYDSNKNNENKNNENKNVKKYLNNVNKNTISIKYNKIPLEVISYGDPIFLYKNGNWKNNLESYKGNTFYTINPIQRKLMFILNMDVSKGKRVEWIKNNFYIKIVSVSNNYLCNEFVIDRKKELNKIKNNNNNPFKKLKMNKGCITTKPLGTPGKMGTPYVLKCKSDNKEISFIDKSTPFSSKTLIVGKMSSPLFNPIKCKIDMKGGSDFLVYTEQLSKTNNKYLCGCRLTSTATEFLYSDPFAQQTILGAIVNEILWNNEYHGRCMNSVYFYDAFLCIKPSLRSAGLNGWNLMSFATKGELSGIFTKKELANELKTVDIMVILGQIFFALDILLQYEFVHGDLKAKNVFLRETNNIEKKEGINYNNIKINKKNNNVTLKNMKYTVCLADFDKSVITYNSVRFSNYPSKNIKQLESIFSKHKYNIEETKDGIYYYRLPDFSKIDLPRLTKTAHKLLKQKVEQSVIYSILRFLGVRYYDSLDLYMLLSSLMYHEYFFDFVTMHGKDGDILRNFIKIFFIDATDYGRFMDFFTSDLKKEKWVGKREKLGVTLEPYLKTTNVYTSRIKLKCNVMDDIKLYYKELSKLNEYKEYIFIEGNTNVNNKDIKDTKDSKDIKKTKGKNIQYGYNSLIIKNKGNLTNAIMENHIN